MIKLTKTELRTQQHHFQQLNKYLPTLQLKKMLLQVEVNQAEQEIDQMHETFNVLEEKIRNYCALFTDQNSFDLFLSVKVLEVQKQTHNIAGIDIPVFEKVIFQPNPYFLFDTPVWVDGAVVDLQKLIEIRENIRILEEKKAALEHELHDVSVRVNLFEKVLIPRALEKIRKIKIFLGDQQLAAICQAKVAKQKILEREKVL